MTDSDCQHCNSEARWSWHTGMGAAGRYCDKHAKEELPPARKLDSYKDVVTTEDNVTLLGGNTAIIPGGGVKPIGERLPVIRSVEAFERYEDGE